MDAVSLSVEAVAGPGGDRYRMVTIELEGAIEPPDFAEAVAGIDLAGGEPVLITGRAPVWGYAMLVHAAHATPAVATFDPRLDGFVVVQSHDRRFAPGDIITSVSV